MEKEFIGKTIYTAISNRREEEARKLLDENETALGIATPIGIWMHVAARHGCFELIKYLIGKGLDINAAGGSSKSTPINSAAGSGHIEIVEYFLEHDAILDTNEPETNPIYSAILGGHTKVVEILIGHGIDVSKEYENSNALIFAERYDRKEIVTLIRDRLNIQ